MDQVRREFHLTRGAVSPRSAHSAASALAPTLALPELSARADCESCRITGPEPD